jgi:hypothetical protein
MKVRKEDIQKIALSVLMGVGVVYGYFSLLLGPLKRQQLSTTTSLTALEPEIKKAQADLERSKQIQADAPKAAATMAQIDAMIPEGAPVAWFPTLVSDFFKKQGVEKITTRMSSEVAEKDLAGYRRINWGVDVPRVDCLAFAASLAELENQEPLLEIQGLTIETLKEDPEAQHVLLTLNNIVKP